MSIHKHDGPRGTRYEVRYRGVNGKERSKRFDTKKAAEAYERQQRTAVQRGDWTDPQASRITLAEWVDEWQRSTVHLTAKTRKTYADSMRLHVLPDVVGADGNVTFEGLGAIPLNKLTTGHLTDWIAALIRKPRRGGSGGDVKPLAPGTAHQAYRVLNVALNAAVAKERLGRNPLAGVKPPRVEQKEMRFLTEQEVALVADAVDPRYRALVLMGCLCGLRAGEMLALRWENVDMLTRTLRVVEQTDEMGGPGAVKPPKSEAGRRAVSMPRAVTEALAAHATLGEIDVDEVDGDDAAETQPDGTDDMPRPLRVVAANETGAATQRRTGLVFTAPEGGPIDLRVFRRRVWAKALTKAGIEGVRIHDMRHTAASLAIKAGADVKMIQSMLGHASAVVTLDRYGHLMPGQAEAVADRLDALMQAAG